MAYAEKLSGIGIESTVWRMLAVLRQHDDLTHRELAELSGIEVSTLSRIGKAVQQSGYIRRKRTIQDQRTVRTNLTATGRELVEKGMPLAKEMQELVSYDLPREDIAELMRILKLIIVSLQNSEKTPTNDGR